MSRKISETVAFLMYAGEPCRICGKKLTPDDIRDGAVFAGYSADCKSRSAHQACWNDQPPKARWAYPKDESKG